MGINAGSSSGTGLGLALVAEQVRCATSHGTASRSPNVRSTHPSRRRTWTQLVCTFTARAGIGQVAFTLSGAPVDVPRGDGSLTADPVSRDDYAELLP